MRSLARSLAMALACAVGGSALCGCLVSGAVGRATASLFASPRKVTKLGDPIDKEARLAVLWIGHATALVQIDDKVILTDPVFASTVGQVSKRLVEPGLQPENLPPIDAVLISHMHFDHLSLGSLSTIEKKVRMLVMPPKGVTYLTDFGFPVLELQPWQAWEKDGLRVTAAPVDHVGFRYGLDDAWMKGASTGYVVEYHGIKVYFAGDTAYDQRLFADTRERFPDIDLALLPIGPIEPRQLMRRFHLDPSEALQAFFDLGAKRFVPVHYDTFINATDGPGDALRQLGAAKKKWSLGAREVAPLAIGERRVFVRKPRERDKDDATAEPAPDAKPTEGSPAPSPAPAPAPTTSSPPPKDDIPDDDRLD